MQLARYLTIFSAATIFGVAASLIATQGGKITTRAVGRPECELWSLVLVLTSFLKLGYVGFQRATSELHQTPLSSIADNAKSAHT